MKKILLLALLAIAMINPFSAFGQKKKKDKKKDKVEAVVLPVIQTEADTLSYALGQNMVEGLPQYLIQQGVFADTTGVTGLKLDSIKLANENNLDKFLAGFEAGINTDEGNKSYNSGFSVAGQISNMTKGFAKDVIGDEQAFNMGAFVYAFKSALKKGQPLVVIENANALIQEKAQAMQSTNELKAQAGLKAQYADKIAEGEAFMAENKTKEGVVTLPDGLQYKEVKAGAGKTPKMGERVKVHYHGTLLDGTVFDSSVNRGEPVSFNVGQLIKGFNEALTLMSEGSKWIVYIPYDLAYGAADQGAIKPFSNLIFEIELLEVEPAAAE